MARLDVALEGGDKLAATARAASEQLAAGLDHEAAAQEVIGYIRHPGGTPAGIARGLHVEPLEDGFALAATGSNDGFLTRFLTDPFDVRAQAVVDQYATQLQELLDTIEGA